MLWEWEKSHYMYHRTSYIILSYHPLHAYSFFCFFRQHGHIFCKTCTKQNSSSFSCRLKALSSLVLLSPLTDTRSSRLYFTSAFIVYTCSRHCTQLSIRSRLALPHFHRSEWIYAGSDRSSIERYALCRISKYFSSKSQALAGMERAAAKQFPFSTVW